MPPDIGFRIEKAFEAGLAEGVFPGASLLVAKEGSPIAAGVFGHAQKDGGPVTPATWFDLASLTKPLVTAPLCMVAIARGLIALDDPLARFFPEDAVPAEKREITVRHLLSHASGFPAHRPFYLELVKLPPEKRKETLIQMILQTPLNAPPGSVAVYSDLGFMLLGTILERVFGGRLDGLAKNILFTPLGVDELSFFPAEAGTDPEIPVKGLRREIAFAATQECPLRKRLLVGEVDDENAWCLGGVAPHAGLFGTAAGVLSLISHLWGIYAGRMNKGLLPRDLVKIFWQRTKIPEESTWALGYDTPSPVNSSAGHVISKNSVGHLGFTGTSFWLDLDRQVLIVLLTNRVHPSRQNDAIRQFRPLVHDIIMEALKL